MLKYEIKEKLRTSDYDMYDRVKIHSLFDIFQDVAGDHAAMHNYDRPRCLLPVRIPV